MPLFKVAVRGNGLWISVDDELQRVEFRVSRVVEAVDAEQAAQQALALVRNDSRSQPLPGGSPPSLTVDEVTPTATMPPIQAGFAFYPDPE